MTKIHFRVCLFLTFCARFASIVPRRRTTGCFTATKRRRGCQIDLLLLSDRKACIVEIKRKAEIGREIETEVEAKVDALALPRDVSVRTALVYEGHLAPVVEADGYFDAIVPFRALLGL